MLAKIQGLPAYVAAFKATGKVDKDDYDNILIPELERVDKEHGHIHFLLVLETPVKNFSAGAWLQDIWMGIKHFRGWKKMAIVTGETGVEKFTDVFTHFVPGKARGFKLSELEAAKQWVALED